MDARLKGSRLLIGSDASESAITAVPIRRFVRDYVKSEAQAVTQQLRRREAAGALSGYRVDKYQK
jgi:hypothetical protein